VYRLTWRLPLAGLVAFSHLQFSQIRGRQPYLIVRNILYVIGHRFGSAPISPGDDVEAAARKLLKEKSGYSSFYQPISYPRSYH